jgi:hypothetical protein
MVVPGSYVWIVGPTMDLAEKEFRVAWKLIVDKGLIPVRRKSERELFIQCENGSFLECRSEENPDQLVGEGLDLVVLAEAARLKLRTFDQYIRPAIADRKGKILATSTPRGFNWFYDFYERGQSEEGTYHDWESWMIPTSENPIIGAEEIAAAKATSSPEAFAQEWEAKFIAYGGLVFPEFSYETHVRAISYVGGLDTELWIDPGHTAPYCVLLVQITPDEQVLVLDEIYKTGLTSDRIISIAEKKWKSFILDDYDHPKVKVTIDRAAAEAAATWRLRGYDAGGDKPKIEQGIEVYHMFLRDPMQSQEAIILPNGEVVRDALIVPRVFYDPKCKNVIKEHGLYHYPDETRKRIDTNPTNKPVDVDNHGMDAVRYGLRNRFPTLFNESPESENVVYLTPDEMGMDMDSIIIESSEY